MSEQSLREYRAGFGVPEGDPVTEADGRKPYSPPELRAFTGDKALLGTVDEPSYHERFRQKIEELSATGPELHEWTGNN